ncbi:hypothetical protein KI387_000349, partial [Taxus chinensis]
DDVGVVEFVGYVDWMGIPLAIASRGSAYLVGLHIDVGVVITIDEVISNYMEVDIDGGICEDDVVIDVGIDMARKLAVVGVGVVGVDMDEELDVIGVDMDGMVMGIFNIDIMDAETGMDV